MSLRGILKGLFASVIISTVVILVASVIMYFSNVSENILSIAVYVGVGAALITGSIICARISDSRILINCLCHSALYLLLLIICSLIKDGNILFNTHFFAVSGAIFGCGILGAIVGK